jgi:hypothetical protein
MICYHTVKIPTGLDCFQPIPVAMVFRFFTCPNLTLQSESFCPRHQPSSPNPGRRTSKDASPLGYFGALLCSVLPACIVLTDCSCCVLLLCAPCFVCCVVWRREMMDESCAGAGLRAAH